MKIASTNVDALRTNDAMDSVIDNNYGSNIAISRIQETHYKRDYQIKYDMQYSSSGKKRADGENEGKFIKAVVSIAIKNKKPNIMGIKRRSIRAIEIK